MRIRYTKNSVELIRLEMDELFLRYLLLSK